MDGRFTETLCRFITKRLTRLLFHATLGFEVEAEKLNDDKSAQLYTMGLKVPPDHKAHDRLKPWIAPSLKRVTT